jgi:hypothetical protein
MDVRYYRVRLLLLGAAILCFVLSWYAARMLGLPAYAGFDASLLRQPSPIIAMLVTAVLIGIGAGIGAAIAGQIRFDTGLFTACVGLMALTSRGGGIRHTLLAAEGPAVYLMLAIEVTLLFGLLGLAWWVLWSMRHKGWLAADPLPEGEQGLDDSLNQKLLAGAMQVVATGLLVSVLAQTEQKLQVLAAVGIASWLGTLAAYHLFPTQPSIWFWMGPLVVALMGYLLAWYSPGDWHIGLASHGLARPLPLDYAAAGPAGALIGYWMSRRRRPSEDIDEAPATP